MVKKEKKAPQIQTASWLDIVWRAVHQLSVINNGQEYFHYYQDICRFVEAFWVRLANGKERTPTWTNTVSSTITTHKRVFKPGPDQGFWGLRLHPVDTTSTEEYEEIRRLWAPIAATAVIEPPAPKVPVFVAPEPVLSSAQAQALRRKRKTGWGDKKSKKIRFAIKKSTKLVDPLQLVDPSLPIFASSFAGVTSIANAEDSDLESESESGESISEVEQELQREREREREQVHDLEQRLVSNTSSSVTPKVQTQSQPPQPTKVQTVMLGNMNVVLSNKKQRTKEGDEDEDQYVDIMTVSESDSDLQSTSNSSPAHNTSDGCSIQPDFTDLFDPSFDFRFETRSFFLGDELSF